MPKFEGKTLKMRTPCCHTCLAFLLKFLNFLQTFIGISIILYSAYMLNEWSKHSLPHPSSSQSPDFPGSMLSNFSAVGVSDHISPLDLAAGVFNGRDDGLSVRLHALPAPWFIYAFMGVGVVLCCITCVGQVAAEAINGCCLCFYSLLTTILILLEAAFVTFVALDHHWEKDLPPDPTGELDSLRNFIETNIDVCKWVGFAVVVIQVLSLLLAIILRAMVSASRVDPDIEGDFEVGGRTWEPLLHPQLGQTSGPYKGDTRGSHSDIWSSRMREKYGLGGGGEANTHNLYNPNLSGDMKSNQ